MSFRPRLRTKGGCTTCKQRRKKCDEERPICAACRRLFLRCSWTPAVDRSSRGIAGPIAGGVSSGHIPTRSRQRSLVPKSIDLSAFRGQVCAGHVLETCFKATNSSLDPVHTERNGYTLQATLSFAPMDTSLAWTCIVAIGLLFVGQRYKDQGLVDAADAQHVQIVNQIRRAVEQGVDVIDLDTVAAINLLGILGVTRFWFGRSSRGDEGIVHAIGLSAVLEAMQPEKFQSAQALALFEYLGFTVIITAVISGRPTSLASQRWRTVPWVKARHERGSMQTLIDLMCDLIPLQSEKRLVQLGPEEEYKSIPALTMDRVARLLIQLQDWRSSIEPGLKMRMKTIDLTGRSTMVYAGDGCPIQFEQPTDLFQLALFNMILIYLCSFFIQDGKGRQRDAPQIEESTGAQITSERLSPMPTTPLVLPISDPIARAKVAAKEILVLWQCLTNDGLFGCGSFYLSVPLIVAKIFLLREGDAGASDLNEALDRIPAIWAGRK